MSDLYNCILLKKLPAAMIATKLGRKKKKDFTLKHPNFFLEKQIFCKFFSLVNSYDWLKQILVICDWLKQIDIFQGCQIVILNFLNSFNQECN